MGRSHGASCCCARAMDGSWARSPGQAHQPSLSPDETQTLDGLTTGGRSSPVGLQGTGWRPPLLQRKQEAGHRAGGRTVFGRVPAMRAIRESRPTPRRVDSQDESAPEVSVADALAGLGRPRRTSQRPGTRTGSLRKRHCRRAPRRNHDDPEGLKDEARFRSDALSAGEAVRRREARRLLTEMPVDRLKEAARDRLRIGPLTDAGSPPCRLSWTRERTSKSAWHRRDDGHLDARSRTHMRQSAMLQRGKSQKAQRLIELVEEAEDNGRSVIVFSHFRDVLERVAAAHPGEVFGPLTGSVPAAARQAMVDRFSDAGHGAVLVSQIVAGGVGLNIDRVAGHRAGAPNGTSAIRPGAPTPLRRGGRPTGHGDPRSEAWTLRRLRPCQRDRQQRPRGPRHLRSRPGPRRYRSRARAAIRTRREAPSGEGRSRLTRLGRALAACADGLRVLWSGVGSAGRKRRLPFTNVGLTGGRVGRLWS